MLGRSEPHGKRPRRVFDITAAGRAALRAWLGNSDPIAFELRDVGMLKLFFADAQDPEDALALLEAVRRRSTERVDYLRAIEPEALAAADDSNKYPHLTLRMGIAFHEAMIDVCAEFERNGGTPTLPGPA